MCSQIDLSRSRECLALEAAFATSSTAYPLVMPLSPQLPGSLLGDRCLTAFTSFSLWFPNFQCTACKTSLFSLVWHPLRYTNSPPSPHIPTITDYRGTQHIFLWLFSSYVSFRYSQKDHKQKACKMIKLIFFICRGASLLGSLEKLARSCGRLSLRFLMQIIMLP